MSILDNAIDWFVVTIVGFLTAIAAFLIVRAEQSLFDLKEGRCVSSWWHARRFCSDWQEWSEVFGRENPERRNDDLSWAIEYVIYALVAVSSEEGDRKGDQLINLSANSSFFVGASHHISNCVAVLHVRQRFRRPRA